MPKIPYSKRKDGRYYKQIIIGIDSNGKRKVKTLYDKDWRELDKKVREFEINLGQGKYIEEDITLKECIDLWWKTKVNIADATKNNYKSLLKHTEIIQHMKMKDIKVMHIQNIYKDMCDKSLYAALSQLHPLMKNIFRFAQNNNFISVNITDRVYLPKIKRGKRRSLSSDEKIAITKAYDIFNRFEKTFVMFLYYTGMRRNEILALQKSDIDFQDNIIMVHKTLVTNADFKTIVQQHTKSEAGMRNIPMVYLLRKYLKDVLNDLEEDEFIFLSNQKNLIQNTLFDYKWKGILQKINQFMPEGKETNITPHYFRHNFATEAIYAGVPIKTVQYIMGHENSSMTMDIYADVIADNDNTSEILSQYWDNKSSISIDDNKYVKSMSTQYLPIK